MKNVLLTQKMLKKHSSCCLTDSEFGVGDSDDDPEPAEFTARVTSNEPLASLKLARLLEKGKEEGE